MKKSICIGLALLALTGVQLWAQANASATLQGVVVDSSKAVVPNADITVSSTETGLKRTEKSGADGAYRFDQLPAGAYEVVFKATGFATEKFPKVELQVAINTELNATLNAGSVSDTITV